jgi:hypothetical protein
VLSRFAGVTLSASEWGEPAGEIPSHARDLRVEPFCGRDPERKRTGEPTGETLRPRRGICVQMSQKKMVSVFAGANAREA